MGRVKDLLENDPVRGEERGDWCESGTLVRTGASESFESHTVGRTPRAVTKEISLTNAQRAIDGIMALLTRFPEVKRISQSRLKKGFEELFYPVEDLIEETIWHLDCDRSPEFFKWAREQRLSFMMAIVLAAVEKHRRERCRWWVGARIDEWMSRWQAELGLYGIGVIPVPKRAEIHQPTDA